VGLASWGKPGSRAYVEDPPEVISEIPGHIGTENGKIIGYNAVVLEHAPAFGDADTDIGEP
jgi:hypothetical protein